MRAHRFLPAVEEDHDHCDRCEVTVRSDALVAFSLPCPAGDCQSSNNPDRGCVVIGEPGRCLYCGRQGGDPEPAVDGVHEFDPDEEAFPEV